MPTVLNKLLKALKLNPYATAKGITLLPCYFRQLKTFRKLQGQASTSKTDWPISGFPILYDKNSEAASLGEYFWQDLLVAKEVIKQSPSRHVDVGSRVDGFVAHIACVRRVEVLDIRPLTSEIENIEFVQWDMTEPNSSLNNSADCVSCLHTLEHIGLGRYGDKLDPDGWKKGLKSLADLVAPGGGLWLSVPIGLQRVEFNAHRVFNPETIINAASNIGVTLERFFYLSDSGFVESMNIAEDSASLQVKHYNLGIFFFRR